MTQPADVMKLKPGSRWRSAVSEAEVVVVRPPARPVILRIGGARVLAADADRPADARPDESLAEQALLGKRYADQASGLELLCTRSGAGTITVDGRPTKVKAPRQLPASD